MQSSVSQQSTLVSLDDVVQQALLRTATAAQVSFTPPALTRSIVSHLTDPDNMQSSGMARTPTAEALQAVCHAFVARYRTPDALLLDTAWLLGETSRLREGGDAGIATALAPSDTLNASDAEELLRHTTDVVRMTHESATRETLSSSRSYLPCLSSPFLNRGHVEESGEINVLQLDDASGMMPEGTWESLEFTASSEVHQGSNGIVGGGGGGLYERLRKEEEGLRVLDVWAVTRDGVSDDSRSNTAHADVRLESLELLLRRRPELVTQHAELLSLQRGILAATSTTPTDRWTKAAFTLFQALPARSQLDFVHALLSTLKRFTVPTSPPDTRYMSFVQEVLHELPQGWLPLLDTEVTECFLRVMSELVLPWGAALDTADPEATWLVEWDSRPSLALAIDSLLDTQPHTLRELRGQLPQSHAACVLLYLLPHMCKRAALMQRAREAATAAEEEEAGDVEECAVEQPWVAVFEDVLHRLCSLPITGISASVYEVAAHAMCRAVRQLPQPMRALCFTELTEKVLLQWRACKAAAESGGGARVVFAVRLVTQLLCDDEEGGTSWCTAHTWELVDSQLYSQLRLAMRAQRAPSTASTAAAALSSKKQVRLLSEEEGEVVRQCWSRLLSCHGSRLPNTLATAVEEVVASLDVPSRAPHLFTWHTLVRVSSTLLGWTALQPHLRQLTRGIGTSAPQRWTALLRAIVEAADGMASERHSQTRRSTTHATPTKSGAKGKKAGDGEYCHISSFSPACVALLQRWATCADALHGLAEAAHLGALSFLKRVQRSDGALEGTAAPPSASPMRWPLLWPVEAYPQAGPTDLSYAEDTSVHARQVRSLASYQSICLFLRSIAPQVPPAREKTTEALEDIWKQLTELWLAPAQVTNGERSVSEETPVSETVADKPETNAPVTNRPPFDEASLLTLLCAAAVCVLVRHTAEYAAWLSPASAVPQCIHPLRRFCQARKGVDPVYFLVRFLTSSKGRKRLPAILLDGFEAELTVDVVIDTDAFVDGEDLPSGELASLVSDQEVEQLLAGAFPTKPKAAQEKGTGKRKRELSRGGVAASWPSGVAALARTLLSHRVALKATEAELQQCFARRNLEEWAAFTDLSARALAVATLLEEEHVAAVAVLRGAHVDAAYLTLLCVSNWLQLPDTHSTSARRKLCWAALQHFSLHGITTYDVCIARSLAAHVDKLQHESASLCADAAVVFPLSRPLPLPCPLFVLLLAKPFSLVLG